MNRKLNILYLSQYFPPEMGAPSARVFELSRSWVKYGSKVKVITGFPNHPTGKIPSSYKQHFLKFERLDGIHVIRTYIYPAPNKGFFKRIISYMSFMFSSVFVGSWYIGKPDLIIATSPQFFVAIAGFILSRIKNRPFILEIRDLWPDSIVQLGQLKNRLIIRLLEMIEKFLYLKATLIIVVANSSVSVIQKKGINRNKIRTIKNGVDLKLFNPDKFDSILRTKLGLKNKFVIGYIGTLGLSHALDKVIFTANMLKTNLNIQFLFIGEGAEKGNLKKLAKDLNLTNVTFLNQVEKSLLPFYYSVCDIILVTLKKIPLFESVIPSKMFEIMAMAKPIILSVNGESKELVVTQANAGIFVEPENSEMMKEAILNLSMNHKLCYRYGLNGYEYVKSNFDRDQLAISYFNYLISVVAKN